MLKSVGIRYWVLTSTGETIECVLRGKLRVKGVETTNPVAVGDTVVFELLDDGKSGLITKSLNDAITSPEIVEPFETVADYCSKYRPGPSGCNHYSSHNTGGIHRQVPGNCRSLPDPRRDHLQ